MSDVQGDQQQKIPSTNTKAKIGFWMNVGIFFSCFAVIVLVFVTSRVAGRLFTANAQMTELFSQSQQKITAVQEALDKIRADINNQNNSIEQMQKAAASAANVATEKFLVLSRIDSEIEQIPLLQHPITENKLVAQESAQPEQRWWKRFLLAVSDALSRIVIVRPVPLSSPPFVAADQKLTFYQNIRSELENAKWAVLHQQPAIYQASIQQISGWLTTYAEPNNAMTQQVLKELDGIKEL